MITLGEKVKKAREDSGMSIEALSQITRISSTQLRNIETGKSNDFLGDEQYLKMYLKRIANALEIEENYFFEDFLAWTQGVSATELADAIAASEEKANKKDKNIAYHVNDSIQQAKKKQAYSKNKKHVYEDRYITRYLKYLIVGCLVFAIMFLVWKVVSLTSQLDANYIAPDVGSVENSGEVENELPDDEPEVEVEEDDMIVSDNVVISSEDGAKYIIGGIMEGEIISIEVTFLEETQFNLWSGATQVEGAYKTNYQIDEKYTYESTCSSGAVLTFNFWNLESSVVKVNGNEVEYDLDKLTKKDGVTYLTLVFTGE